MSHLSNTSRFFAGIALALWLALPVAPLAAALSTQEQAVADRVINDAGQGRASVTVDPILSAVARAKARDMAEREYFSHTDPDGYGANYLVRRAGYSLPGHYSTANNGNNIESLAAGYASVADVWSGWMNSSSHKTHILGQTSFFAEQISLGVGYHYDASSPYRHYWVIITAPPGGPRLTITSPAANAALTVAQVNVSGTTAGAPAADRVEVRVENAAGTGSYVVATGRTAWAAAINGLQAGTNTLRVRSLNASGGVILELTRAVRLIVSDTLNVTISGSGTVTAGFTGATPREVGRAYTIAARPVAGWLFKNWSGGISATTAALTFRMTEDLALTANFVPNPFIARIGTYTGLAETSTFAHGTSGLVRIGVTSTGVVTGRFWIGGRVYAFSTRLNTDGRGTVVIARGTLAPLTVTLQLDVTGASERISGTISDGDFTASFGADRNWQPGGGPSAFAGRYTLALPGDPDEASAPTGAGWAVLSVTTRGVAVLSGSLADGTPLSVSGYVSDEGLLPLYRMLYGVGGSFAGELQFGDTGSADVEGKYYWTKPPLPTARVHRSDFAVENVIVGSRYTAPPAGTPVLAVTNVADNASLAFAGGNLVSAIRQPVSLTTANRVVIAAPSVRGLSAVIVPSVGRFTGSFLDPTTNAVRRFSGVILERQSEGVGYFLGTDRSGLVEFTPADDGSGS